MQYYGTRLSENISKREPEGYLLCLNVPVARTGVQEYLPEELGLPPVRGDPGKMIPVERPEEEVFSKATIASFEGMPVTNDHPPEGVTLENIRYLQKGHADHIRRGSGDESDLLLADLMITDPVLIDAIMKEGKREISCGYVYELREENGQYVQRNIRGNHIAVVDAGRAGPRVSIRDRYPEIKTDKNGRRRIVMKKALYKKLVRMARDGDAEALEAVAEFMEQMIEGEEDEEEQTETVAFIPMVNTEPEEEKKETPTVIAVPEGKEITIDSELGAAILEKLDQLIALMTPKATDEEPTDENETGQTNPVQEIVQAVTEAVEAGAAVEESGEVKDPLATEVAEIGEEMVEQSAERSTVIEQEEEENDECAEENGPVASDTLKAALRAVKPALMRMPKEQRDRACAEIAKQMRKGKTAGVYAALARAQAKDQKVDETELGKRIMEKRNPHYKQ